MKKQTYISHLEDKDGNVINFHRWSYKRATTVARKLKEFYSNPTGISKNLHKRDLAKTKQIAIYATPDGYNKEEDPALVIPVNEIVV